MPQLPSFFDGFEPVECCKRDSEDADVIRVCFVIDGFCALYFNEDDLTSPYQGVQIGEDIAVKIAGKNAAGFLELLPEVKKVR